MSGDLPSSGLLVPLAGSALLDAAGEDAATFLQAQLTADVTAVGQGRSTLAALCDVKGRVLALFRLVATDAGFEIRVPRGTLGILRGRLELYRMHAKVDFDEPGPGAAVFGLAGRAGEAALAALVPALPARPDDAAHGEGIAAVRVDDTPRYEVAVRSSARARFDEVTSRLPSAGDEAWTRLDALGGIPRVTEATSGAFLPQMLDLGPLGAVSFTKGCFPGQEVVARTEHLGAVKRRLFRARVAGVPPEPGSVLRAMVDGRERDGGRVVIAAPDGDSAVLLAVIPIDVAERAALHAGTVDGPRVEVEAGRPEEGSA